MKAAVTIPTTTFWSETPHPTTQRAYDAAFDFIQKVVRVLEGVKEVVSFVLVCAALFGALYAAAAVYGAGKSTYVSVMGTLLDPPRDDALARTIANFCDARINWMTINGPGGHMTRARIYSQLDQACPDSRKAIDKLRLTRPA